MQGDASVIAGLNQVLAAKLTYINQLYLHGRMGINWGYHRIGGKVTKQSIEVMKQASKLTDRILLLEGLPNLQKLNTLSIGEDIQEQVQNDLQTALTDAQELRSIINLCTSHNDHGTRHLLEEFLEEDEEYIDWLEEQLGLMQEVGLQNYLATQT